MNFETFLKSVSKIKNLNLPGESSQFKMSPPFRRQLMDENREKMKYAKKAGVLALFYPDQNINTNLILILRKTYKGVHSAQVGFPGGKLEKNDPDLAFTALRETEEEVGVIRDTVEIIKPLTQLYIPPSNFTVAPFLGVTEKTPTFIKQEDEVEDLIEVSLLDFMDDKNTRNVKVMTSYNVELEVPAFDLNGYIIWGATAMMMSELKDLLKITL